MYEGPGIYEHYKGGHYRVWGVAQHESEGYLMVIYSSLNLEHELSRVSVGIDFVARPLTSKDGDDAFNQYVAPSPGIQTKRFCKIS
jgi:hypothetical protein